MQLGCESDVMTIVAMLSVENIYINKIGKVDDENHERKHAIAARSSLYHEAGDHLTYLNSKFNHSTP